MNKMLMNEWMKIKNSRLIYFSFICVLFAPFALLLLIIILNSDPKFTAVTYLEYMSMTLKFMTSVVGLTLYTWIAAEIVAMEFRLDTIKSQLTIPIARTDFLFLKLTMVSFMTALITVLSFITALIISFSLDLTGLDITLTIKLLFVYIKSTILVMPFLYFTVWLVLIFKQSFIPMIINGVLLITTFIIGKTDLYAIFPWTAPTQIIFLATGEESSFSINDSYFAIILLGLVSMYLAYRRINKMEI